MANQIFMRVNEVAEELGISMQPKQNDSQRIHLVSCKKLFPGRRNIMIWEN